MARTVYDKVQFNKPRKSAFDLSREVKLSCNMGELIPAYIEEILPSDEFQVNSEIMLRLAPLVSPVMHRVNVFMHYFFVPNRLVWDEWEDFITGGREGTSNPSYPRYSLTTIMDGSTNGNLADYLGLPNGQTNTNTSSVQISQIPFRAYHLIWNEYYRDPNLHSEVDVKTANQSTLTALKRRCWEKDYFTSALPWPERGDAVSIPVVYKDPSEVYDTGADDYTPPASKDLQATDQGSFGTLADQDGNQLRLESVEGIDVNDLRVSSALQRWLETSARGGYRYIETILAHFGKRSSDQRLQRPEYLGGGKQNVVISEVMSTAETLDSTDSVTNPAGQLHGHGIAVGNQNRFRREFEEHGYVLGILSVMPRTGYQQGIHRHWSRTEKEDYYWPLFANLGEQEIKNKEIYWDDSDDDTYNESVFGYQQRYAEYKYGCSRSAGEFKDTLDHWHINRIFANQPSLNTDFLEYPARSSSPDKRIFAVQDNSDKLWVQVYHNVQARRPMPFFADPRLT